MIADYSSLDGVEAENSLCTYTFLGKHTCGQSPMTTAAALARQRIVEQACAGTGLVEGKYILSCYFY